MLGESELDYVRVFPKHRTGDFLATELGETLMPVATGPTRVVLDFARTRVERWGRGEKEEERIESYAGLPRTSEDADLAEAYVHRESLDLELHSPDGHVIPTEWIDIRDTELLLQFAELKEEEEDEEPFLPPDDDPELAQAIEHDSAVIDEMFDDWSDFDAGDEPWHEETPFPRYQIQVMLRDDAAVP